MLYDNEYPLNGEDMVYDNLYHMYVLTKDFVRTQTGIDMELLVQSPFIVDKATAVNNILRDMSIQVYMYVYGYNMRYKDYTEYLMAKSPIARELIRNALLKQLSYTIRNGKIDEYAGVNVSYNQKNASTELADIRGERSIHPEAIAYLSMPIENGEKLLFTGNYRIPNGIHYRTNY